MHSRTWKTRLHAEPLEDRTLMSTCHVTRLSDTGAGKGFRGDLRYCINKVNAEPGPDSIDFNVTGSVNLTAALPNLNSDIDIQGPGMELLTIDARQKSRVFYVAAGGSVELSGLTLTGGYAGDSGYPWTEWHPGGGIYNAGSLMLHDCTVSGNIGQRYGGGIYNEGTARISNCTISNNQVNKYPYYTWGGGIYNAASGFLVVSNAVVSGNRNDSGLSYIANGAGIANFGQANIFYSTISGNIANPVIYTTWGGSGGGIYNGGNLLVDSSLISHNVAAGDFFGYGGGISNGTDYSYPGGNVTIVNSTIVENLAFAAGEWTNDSRGGGIASRNGGTVTINNSTIARNQTKGGEADVVGLGGGVSVEGSQLYVTNTIVAGNAAKTSSQDFFGILTASGYNLFEDSAGGSGYALTDILDVNPLLGPLQANGGPTFTIALLSGSPAIDAGDNADAPAFDQRGPGFPRIVNGTIDIGAFEVQATGAPNQPHFLAFLITADSNKDEWETFP